MVALRLMSICCIVIQTQPSIDGNTVDSQIEKAQFAKNSMDYNTTFEFLSGRFKGMRNALRGE